MVMVVCRVVVMIRVVCRVVVMIRVSLLGLGLLG